jgi:quercetin dioxygenase-like cupin family protein
MTLNRGKLFAKAIVPTDGERMVELARIGGTTIETILSSADPDQNPYDQPHDEWVVLLDGTAELEVDGEPVSLGAGDWLLIPARTPHRVLATSAGARWIAVHVR